MYGEASDYRRPEEKTPEAQKVGGEVLNTLSIFTPLKRGKEGSVILVPEVVRNRQVDELPPSPEVIDVFDVDNGLFFFFSTRKPLFYSLYFRLVYETSPIESVEEYKNIIRGHFLSCVFRLLKEVNLR